MNSIVSLSQGAVPNLQSNIHITPLAFDVVGIERFGVTALEDMALATSLTYSLLLSRLGIIQANLASPLTAPSVRDHAGISMHQGHRPDALLWWSSQSGEVA